MIRLILAISLLFLLSCSGKKKSLSSDEVKSTKEFVESFPDATLPYIISDSVIDNKLGDSSLISAKLVRQFLPDTLFRDFKGSKPKYYALGKATAKSGENYLFVKAATAGRQTGYILCFDKDDNFKAGMPLVTNSNERDVHYEGGLDKKFTIIKNRSKQSKDGQVFYNKNVYVYNNVGTFTLILQESNEALEVKEIFNPIDSLAMKGKWSGNYVKDKKNFVSVRDGARDNKILFFIHFEEQNGDCTGELKGEAELIKPGLARYSAAGDPCSLEFVFTAGKVTITELQGCGNYRGIRCFFNGSYPKKAIPKKKKTAPRK